MSKKKDCIMFDKQKENELNAEFTKPCLNEKINFFKEDILLKVDKNYQYKPQDKKWKRRESFTWRIAKIISFAIVRVFYLARIINKKELKKLGKYDGAISVSNHVLYLDNMFVRYTLNKKKVHYIVHSKNCINTRLGRIMKLGGILPLSDNARAMLNLAKAMKEYLKEGRVIHFYAEEEMWPRYNKPRPLNEGAFYFVVNYEVPIIPIYISFRDNSRIREILHLKQKLQVEVGEIIFPEKREDKKEYIKELRDRTERSLIDMYIKTNALENDAKIYKIKRSALDKIKDHREIMKHVEIVED